MRVLFFNHTGLVSGAERSLLELLGALPRADFQLLVASPEGPLAEHVRALGLPHRAVPGTTGSFKLSLAGTPRSVAEMVWAGVALRGLAHRFGADLVHANSIRSGLIAAVSRRLGGPPVVVHARDTLEGGRAAGAVRTALRGSVSHVIAISAYVERALELGHGRPPTTVLHNPVDLARFDPDRIDRGAARSALGAAGDEPLLGVLAQITPWKAQDDAVRALAMLKAHLPGARLLLVGEVKFVQKAVRFDNPRFRAELATLAARLGVESSVAFLGEREDVPAVLAALDLVLVPSWSEPFGRAVIEGMAMGRVVLATSEGGPAEVIVDGVDGRLLPPRRPDAWAAAAREILGDAEARQRMGHAARASAARFDRTAYAARVATVYRSVLAGAGG